MRIILSCLICFLLTGTALAQDQVFLKNGESYSGDIVSVGKKRVRLKTPYATLKFDRVQVKSIRFSSTIDQQLIAHFPLNGNTQDASGNGHKLTVHGAVPGTDRFGKMRQAYRFDGVDDFMETDLSVTGAFTINLWYDFTENEAADLIGIIHSGIKPKTGWKLYFPNPGNVIRFINYPPRFMGDYKYASPISGWHMLSLAYDETNCYVYLDGVLITQKALEGMVPPAGKNITIGYCGSYFTKGKIDDVRIYSGALSQEEIGHLLKK